MKKSFIISVLLVVFAVGFTSCKKEKSSDKDILEFWVGNVKYNIEGTNISWIYPKTSENVWTGWVAMPAAPSKVELSPGASINPPISTKQDFEAGVTYTITAEDGSQKTYKVMVDRVPLLD